MPCCKPAHLLRHAHTRQLHTVWSKCHGITWNISFLSQEVVIALVSQTCMIVFPCILTMPSAKQVELVVVARQPVQVVHLVAILVQQLCGPVPPDLHKHVGLQRGAKNVEDMKAEGSTGTQPRRSLSGKSRWLGTQVHNRGRYIHATQGAAP